MHVKISIEQGDIKRSSQPIKSSGYESVATRVGLYGELCVTPYLRIYTCDTNYRDIQPERQILLP